MKYLIAAALFVLPTTLAAQIPGMADTMGKTNFGIAYSKPKAWVATTHGPTTVFMAPEGNLSIAVVGVGSAPDAQTAAAKAWAMFKPDAKLSVRLISPDAPGDGWDERASITYETSPGERAVKSALAMRKGTAWTVAITDGAEATANKRSAASLTLEQSLRPAGYAPESFVGRTAHRLTPVRVQALRDFVAESARQLDVPGVGIALIDRGKVVWQGGVGIRKLGSSEPVDAHTRFMIASNTKGMSTLLLSVLVDEGKLRWDQHVTDLYPSFRLGSDATTKSVLVRHLVCACTGLPRKDFAFILADPAPASDTFRQLAQTQPTSDFGELFQYNNLMASAAGYLGGSLAYPGMEIGVAYDKAMQNRIFGPLGMQDTTFDYARGESGDWARPHGYDIDGHMVVMSNYFNHLIAPYRPAGGAWSSPADMARYVQLELSKGLTPDGRRLVSEANLLERRKRGVSIGENGWYGMGLMDRIDSGVEVVTHGGTLQGYHSNWYALPEAGIGAVILTNSDTGAAMLAPFLRRLLEIVYDGKPEAAQQVAAAAARSKAQDHARRERLTFPGDPAVLAGLARRYRNPVDNGTITISDRNGTKWIKAGFIEGPAATHKNADGTVSLISAGPGGIGANAIVGSKNGLRTLTIRDSQHEYIYGEVR
jgi:CubicO group peptidase (beta-lactamase class C family)